MTTSQLGWPAFRHGLGLFQMVVAGRPVLIYAGLMDLDADRYATIEGPRLVYKFQGDVLASASSDMHVIEATHDQVLGSGPIKALERRDVA